MSGTGTEPRRHEVFASYCSSVQAVLLSIGLVVGGGWTVWLYYTLHEEERAAAAVLREQAELSSLELAVARERNAMMRAIGQVSLTATPLALAGSTDCYLQVVAKVANAGNRDIRLKFTEGPPLYVARVRIDRSYQHQFTPIGTAPVFTFSNTGRSVGRLPKTELDPGEYVEHPFLLRLPRKGLYMLEFRVPVDTATVDGTPDPASDGWFWSARTYSTACGEPLAEGRGAEVPPTRIAVSDLPRVE